MPELPEVETIKNALETAVQNAVILKTVVRCRQLRLPVPESFENITQGARMISFKRIGKYIVIGLDNGFCLIWHMGMSGRIKFADKLPQTYAKHDHICFETDRGCLIFNDPRRFGLLTYAKNESALQNPPLKNLGPDPLSKDFDGTYLQSAFQAKKTSIKQVLLDQKIVAGIGNIYASEALYSARILPTRPACGLNESECRRLAKALQETLQKAIAAGGSTLKDYRRPDGQTGYFQFSHCVYGKTGKPCPDCRCNSAKTGGIQKIILGGRSTFYCATLQK